MIFVRNKSAYLLLVLLFFSLIIFQNWSKTDDSVYIEKAKERFIGNLMKQMTIEEKVGQLNLLVGDLFYTGPTVGTVESDKFDERIRKGEITGLFNIYGAEYTAKLQKIAITESRLKIPLIFGADIIHGFKTIMPIPLAEAASWDLDAIEKSARIAAEESSASGIHWTFAPMVDVTRDARWGRAAEGAGEDVFLNCEIAQARVRGFQNNDLSSSTSMAACAKHYVAYGAAEAGRDYNTVDISERRLREIYIPPFNAAINAGVASIMTAFNELNGVPVSGDKWLINEVLRNGLGFDGMVVSDWQSIFEMIPHGSVKNREHAGQLSIEAGVDMDMMSEIYLRVLPKLIRDGSVDIKHVDQAVKNVLDLKYDLGLFDDPFIYCDTIKEASEVRSSDHLEFARGMARKSMVLLKNDHNTLPLSKGVNNIGLIGPLVKSQAELNGTWCFFGEPDHVVDIYQGISNAVSKDCKVLYDPGCPLYAQCENFANAIHIANQSDVVILALGESSIWNGEGASRANIGLPNSQLDLVKAMKETGKPVIALVFCGRPLDLSRLEKYADAIIVCWALGSETGHAISDVLFGDYNPSGKLPISFPRSIGQVPIYYSTKNTGRKYEGHHDEPQYERVYRSRYIDVPNSPLYPFGYGLSYTIFKYDTVKLDRNTISPGESIEANVLVKNTGSFAGEEIVQMYIRDWVGSVTRPVKELKGFKKVFLKPGEEKAVHFKIDQKTLQFLRKDLSWGTEPGKFSVFIGPNSDTDNKTEFILEK